jgi:3-oxoacyl-[acyl-carrier protein] reductase
MDLQKSCRKRTQMGKLDGKVAIVTGAGRGLGRTYARRLASLGAKVAVTDLDLKSYQAFQAEAKDMVGESTVAEIENAGGTAVGLTMDVSDREVVDAGIRTVRELWGRIDILITNAGGGVGKSSSTRASTLDSEPLHSVIDSNLYGTIYCCNAVASVMKEQMSGKIITVSSIAGLNPSRDGGYAHYSVAKAAIGHYTRCLAQDLGPFGITANCIAPGMITTARIVQNVLPSYTGADRDPIQLTALRRLGTVEDCANVVEFLSTDLSDYVTGTIIPVDGGLMR